MLTLYRRHMKLCPHTRDRYFKRCKCPVWVEGTFKGSYVRRSLKLNSWERAQEEIASWGDRPAPSIAVQDAADKFYCDAVNRNLNHSTLQKYGLLFREIISFAEGRGMSKLDLLDVDALRDLRSTWQVSPRTAQKKLERLRSFFRFCQDSGWIHRNPALALKSPMVKPNPTLPYTREEVDRIIRACPDELTEAFVYLLRYSGMRIGDVALLTADKLDGNRLFHYTQKTGVPVHVPLPDFVIRLLRRIELKGNYFFLRGDSTRLETVTDLWRKRLRKVFKAAGVKGHPHRFRDTFAVELLLAGVPLDQVSVLLGHSSIKVTEKHYAPWVRERQEMLEENVRRSWNFQPRLVPIGVRLLAKPRFGTSSSR